MTDKHKIEINQHSMHTATILIDGMPVQDVVRGYAMEAVVGEPTTMTISLISNGMTFEGEAAVRVTPLTRDLLMRMGWTPPTPGMLPVATEGDMAERVDEHHTDETVAKVRAALAPCIGGLSEEDVTWLIESMQNAGILFRERVPVADEPIRKLEWPTVGHPGSDRWTGGDRKDAQ